MKTLVWFAVVLAIGLWSTALVKPIVAEEKPAEPRSAALAAVSHRGTSSCASTDRHRYYIR